MTTLSVDENSGGGVSVGSPITATDPNAGDTVTYSLSGTDAASFAIGSATGQITTIASVTYDHESKSSYSLTVEATDGKLKASIDVTVNLNDVNEAPTFAGSSAAREVAENGPAGANVGAAVTATDPDDDNAHLLLAGHGREFVCHRLRHGANHQRDLQLRGQVVLLADGERVRRQRRHGQHRRSGESDQR